MSIDPSAKLKIITLEQVDGQDITVEAQFNPKEVAVDKSVPWQQQKKKGPNDLEYTGGSPRTMSFELLFDGFETNTSIQPHIDKLHRISEMIDKNAADKKRPPKLRVIWGPQTESVAFPKFEAVIESLAVKYTMFTPDGVAVRATANVKFKEAEALKVGKKQ
jgi:hypothetical protein